jgi:23S rRNA (pseudouridine1915-N3)-methyltransferase
MKITLLQIDKTNAAYLNDGIADYVKRLKNYIVFDIVTINVPKNVKLRSEKEQKTEESRLFQRHIKENDFVIALDEGGKLLDSVEFSAFVQQKMNQNINHLVFVIGGPYGFDEWLYNRADYKLSLSKMTFSHQMVRLFFVEQLYRAYTIFRGEKYHHK